MLCEGCCHRLWAHRLSLQTTHVRRSNILTGLAAQPFVRRLADQAISLTATENSIPLREVPAATSFGAVHAQFDTQPANALNQKLVPSSGTAPEPQKSNQTRIVSSVPAGSSLKGLNYFKNKEDPVALEESKYPRWLWSLLREESGPIEGQKDEVDLRIFAKSANARRMANKRARSKAQMRSDSDLQKVPLYEQTIDLLASDGSTRGVAEATQARQELTRSMRAKRRRDIRESNFLKEMG